MVLTSPQSVLVTGATGFIGRRLVRRLAERGCRVSCVVRADSDVDELRSIGVELLPGDVTDPGSLHRALTESRATAVFHLAGLVLARNLGEFMRVNASGVENIAAACAAQARPPVLVHVSSLAACGTSRGDRLRSESDAAAPVSNYGRSKLAGELAAAKFAGTFPITIVRPPIVYGPGDRAFFEVFRTIERWGIHIVPSWGSGGGDAMRVSLVHVDDLVEGLILAAEKGERLGGNAASGHGIYFVAGGRLDESVAYAELGEAIATALGRRPPAIFRVPGPLLRAVAVASDVASHFRGKPHWINRDKIAEALAPGSWTCSSAKARSTLGWSPEVSLAIRLSDTADWYRQAGWLGGKAPHPPKDTLP